MHVCMYVNRMWYVYQTGLFLWLRWWWWCWRLWVKCWNGKGHAITYRTALSDITCTQMYSCCSRERAQTTEPENYLFIRYIDDMMVVAGGNMVLKIATMMIRRLGDCELFKRFPLEIRVSLLLGKSWTNSNFDFSETTSLRLITITKSSN